MVKVALDAMGGDYAPGVAIEGAVKAVNEVEDLVVVLCGPEEIVKEGLAKLGEENNPRLVIVDAPQEVAMDEAPAAVLKTKQESGLVKCVGLQKAGKVDASVSAGNSGAMMAASLMILGRVGSFSRPAIACLMPSQKGTTVLLDCGANVEVKPQNLVDFGICGSVFAEHALGYENPTVGLLNIGEEEKKGTELLQNTHQLLKKAPINFAGNIEGRDVVFGTTNVIVTDGFTGNVVLKLMEGFFSFHRQEFGDLDSEAGRRFDEGWNYDNIGGGMLVGLKGHAFIAHGSASSTAIRAALKTAAKFARAKIADKVAEKLTGNPE